MNHYFTDNDTLKHDIKTIAYAYDGRAFTFITDAGVFSRDHVDHATDALINSIPPLAGSLLDMGCGYGVLGIVLAKVNGLALTLADVSRQALALAQRNCETNGVDARILRSDCYDNVAGAFDTIVTNPPIRAGKSVTYRMYTGAIDHLNPGGQLYVVNLKKQGADSTRSKLIEVFGNCDTIYKKKGVYVFRCTKPHTSK